MSCVRLLLEDRRRIDLGPRSAASCDALEMGGIDNALAPALTPPVHGDLARTVSDAHLTLRGLLYTVSDHPAWLVSVQPLDGVGNGLFATLAGIVVADLVRGTGSYNLALGLVATAQGVGASLSNVVAGSIVVAAGYNAAFIALAGTAALALWILVGFMPETGRATLAQRSQPIPA
jgi:hypothetical protein